MQLLLVSALASSALASNLLITIPRELQVRQGGQSFVPESQTVTACFSDEIECPGEFQGSKYCSNPGRGDTCCSQGYNCPGTNFCLIDGYCCPDGLSPASCAAANGVSLPADFGKTSAAPVSSETPATTVANVPTSTFILTSETAVTSSIAFVTSSPTPPYVVPGNGTTVGTASGTGSVPVSTSVTPFTGAGSVKGVANGVFAVMGLGMVGAML